MQCQWAFVVISREGGRKGGMMCRHGAGDSEATAEMGHRGGAVLAQRLYVVLAPVSSVIVVCSELRA